MSHRSFHTRRPLAHGLLALTACALAGCGEGSAQGPDPESAPAAEPVGLVIVEPQFAQAPDEIDLGHVLLGRVVERTVRLRNTSAAPVTVRNIRPGCSCTSTRLSYVDTASGELVRGSTTGRGDVLSLPPGVTAELALRVDTSIAPAKNKPKNVIVRITTDSPDTPYLTLNVYMFIESYFLPNPAVLDLRDVAENGGGSGELVLALDNQDGRELGEVISSPLELVPELERQHVSGTILWTLKVRLLPPVPPGRHQYEVLISTTGSMGAGEGEPFPVKVVATGLPDAAIEPATILITPPAPDQAPVGRARVLTRLPGHSLRLESARLEGDDTEGLRVELVAERPDRDGRSGAWGVAIVATEPYGQRAVSGTLIIETDDEQHPRLEARWMYRP